MLPCSSHKRLLGVSSLSDEVVDEEGEENEEEVSLGVLSVSNCAWVPGMPAKQGQTELQFVDDLTSCLLADNSCTFPSRMMVQIKMVRQ